jgi:hypothetical protein
VIPAGADASAGARSAEAIAEALQRRLAAPAAIAAYPFGVGIEVALEWAADAASRAALLVDLTQEVPRIQRDALTNALLYARTEQRDGSYGFSTGCAHPLHDKDRDLGHVDLHACDHSS